jgi:hypothetical protein
VIKIKDENNNYWKGKMSTHIFFQGAFKTLMGLAMICMILPLTACVPTQPDQAHTPPELPDPTQTEAPQPDQAPTNAAQPEPTGESISIRPLWTVSQYILNPDTGWSEQEAEGMLFKPLDINESAITFDGKTCQDVSFQAESVDAETYLQNTYHISLKALGLTDEDMQVITTNCDLPGFQEYMRLSDRRLIISIDGAFFLFEPNVTY